MEKSSNPLTVPTLAQHLKIIEEQKKMSQGKQKTHTSKTIDNEKFIKSAFRIVNESLQEYFSDSYIFHKVFFINSKNNNRNDLSFVNLSTSPKKKVNQKMGLVTKSFVEFIENEIKGDRKDWNWSLTRQIFSQKSDKKIHGVWLYNSINEKIPENSERGFEHEMHLSDINLGNLKFLISNATQNSIICNKKLEKSDLKLLEDLAINHTIEPGGDYLKNYNEFLVELGVSPKDKSTAFRFLLTSYKLHAEFIKQNFNQSSHIYFIRPLSLHNLFDGVLFVCLTRRLQHHEFVQLSEMLTIILQNTVIDRYHHLEREAQWKKIVAETLHSTRHEISALKMQIGMLENGMKNLNGGEVTSQLSELYQQIRIKVESWQQNSEFQFGLLKMEYKRENISRLGNDINKDLFGIRRVKLADVITKAMATLKLTADLIARSDNHKLAILKMLEYFTIDFVKDEIDTCEAALEIVILDVMKNALKATDEHQPSLKLKWYQSVTKKYLRDHLVAPKKDDEDIYSNDYWLLEGNFTAYSVLEVTNNKPIDEETFEFIAGRISMAPDLNQRTNIGIRTIRDILDYDGMSESSKHKWVFQISKKTTLVRADRKDGHTITLLFIPKLNLEGNDKN